MPDIPAHIKSWLELAAEQVLQLRDEGVFIGDKPMSDITLSASPDILLTKTGGTTGHREQGGNYLSYRLQIPDADIRYSIYVKDATTNVATNRNALARAIVWFIPNYGDGTVISRDERAS
ncbi:hypothetical protein V8D89_006228 [Ganoderma adspersum]